MPSISCVKGGNPHKTVNPCLGLQVAVGVLPFDHNRYVFNSRFFSRKDIDYLSIKSPAFSPSQVHPQQHLSPILGLSAAGTGVDVEDGVPAVFRVGEHPLQFKNVEPLFSFCQSVCRLCGFSPILYLGNLQKDFNLL